MTWRDRVLYYAISMLKIQYITLEKSVSFLSYWMNAWRKNVWPRRLIT